MHMHTTLPRLPLQLPANLELLTDSKGMTRKTHRNAPAAAVLPWGGREEGREVVEQGVEKGTPVVTRAHGSERVWKVGGAACGTGGREVPIPWGTVGSAVGGERVVVGGVRARERGLGEHHGCARGEGSGHGRCLGR